MEAPQNPVVGQSWYDISVQPTGQMKIWTGTEWSSATEWRKDVGPGVMIALSENK